MVGKTQSPVRKLSEGFYFFDDLEIGDSYETGAAEVTAEIIRRFAALSGDSYALHLDDEFAREMGFPALIAHGVLIMALADGLKYNSPVRLDAIASLGWDIKFTQPVFAGDRVSATVTVEGKRATGRPDRGIATLAFDTKNQRGKTVQRGINRLMMRRQASRETR